MDFYEEWNSDDETATATPTASTATGTPYSQSYDSESSYSLPVPVPVPADRADIYRQVYQRRDISFSEQPTRLPYSKFDLSGVDLTTGPYPEQGRTQFRTEVQQNASLVTIDSQHRDAAVFPQPTEFTINLPRLYQNVIGINFAQIKLINALYYFRDSKFNTFFDLREEGRQIHEVRIREGSYTINTLITELLSQLNATPPFYYFKTGFEGFITLFSGTGDLFAGFNYPGDYFYDSLNRTFISNPTIDYIIRRYFSQRYVQLNTYPPADILNVYKVAYYYPPLKEAFLDTDTAATAQLNKTYPGLTEQQVYYRVVNNLQSMTDPVIIDLINQNIAFLDTYRTSKTFAAAPVNKYAITLTSNQNRVTIQSDTLNTSIIRDIDNQITYATNIALNENNITAQEYARQKARIDSLYYILSQMYTYYQTQLATTFGINYGTYSIADLSNSSTILRLQNGTDLSGIYSGVTAQYIAAEAAGLIEKSPRFTSRPTRDPSNRWPTALAAQAQPTYEFISETARNRPYDFIRDEPIYEQEFIDSATEYIYVNPKTTTGDIVTTINSNKYTIFKFKSPVRQSLSVETLPRPYANRYEAANEGRPTALYFDMSYSWQPVSGLVVPASTAPIFQDISYQALLAALPPESITDPSAYTLNVISPFKFFSFVAPQPEPSQQGKYGITLTIATQTATPFQNVFTYAIYHDQPSFIADTEQVKPSPFRAKQIIQTAQADQTAQIILNVIAGQQYYIIVKSTTPTFQDTAIQFKISLQAPFQEFTDELYEELPYEPPTADPLNFNYVKVNDTDWMRLPYPATSSPATALYNITYNTLNPISGYDASSISTSFDDYMPFRTEDAVIYAMDPINKYQIQKAIDGTTAILDDINNAPYTPTLTNQPRQTTIAHWPDTHYLPPQGQSAAPVPPQPSLTTMIPFTKAVADLSLTYTYVSRPDVSAASPSISFGGPISAVTFVPPTSGLWSTDRFTFKSAYCLPGGPNDAIRTIGIYEASYIRDRALSEISIQTALMRLVFYKKQHYATQEQVLYNDGFDPKYGSWYEFTRTTSPRKLAIGYSAQPNTIDTRDAIYYVAIPFDSTGRVAEFHMLAGSITPDPASTPTITGNPPTEPQVITPINPATYSSQAIGFQNALTPFEDETSMYDYSPWAASLDATFPGRIDFSLRGAVREGQRSFLLFGKDADSRIDIYEVRLRAYPPSRDTIFCGSIRLEDYLPALEVPITWASLGEGVYVLTAMSSTPTSINVYCITNIASGPVLSPPIPITLNVPAGSPAFSPGSARLYVDVSGRPIVETATHIFSQTATIVRPAAAIDITLNPATNALHILQETATPGEKLIATYETGALSSGPTTSTTIAPVFGAGIVSIRAAQENTLYFLSTNYPDRWLRLRNGDVEVSKPSFSNPLSLVDMSRISWYIGDNGATWFHVIVSLSTRDWMPWRITGNFQKGDDVHSGIRYGWQIFYPTMKVVMTKLANTYNSLVDLEDIQYAPDSPIPNFTPAPDPNYPEQGHALMFFYDSSAALYADLAGAAPGTYKWGHEANYLQADISLNGYYNGAYLPALMLTPGREYYLAVRGYSPSEQFQCITRFRLTNRHDYGFIDISNLIVEIGGAAAGLLTPISPEYEASLADFNGTFMGKRIVIPTDILAKAAPIFDMSFNGFADFYSKYALLNNEYLSAKGVVTSVVDSTTLEVNRYINDNYGDIMPAYYFDREDNKASLNFSLLFASSVDPSLAGARDNWGLGYNLGFYKKDYVSPGDDVTPNRCENRFASTTPGVMATDASGGGATIFRAPNFYRILDEYIYLRMNSEFGFNRIDTTSQENLTRLQDTTGEINNYHAKLLLAPFGSYSTVMIYNPLTLNPPLSRLEKLTFQWVDGFGNVIDNNNAEWSAVLYITERVNRATLDSTWVSTR